MDFDRLEGGNDGLNTVVPTGESRYYALRPGLAIPAVPTARLSKWWDAQGNG